MLCTVVAVTLLRQQCRGIVATAATAPTTIPAAVFPSSNFAAPITGWLLYLGFRSIQLFTMSQSRFIEEEYSKKYRKAANNAAINSAITDLVAARKNRRADGGKS